jgi:hypothetical protein
MQAAVRRHYYNNPPRRPQIISPAPYVVRAGPAFALVVPTQYVVHIPGPENALHPQASGHDLVGGGTEFLIVSIVFVIVAGKVIVRFIRENAPWPGTPTP